MRTLAIDTATPACSVALFDDDALVVATHEVVGRGHAERLIPMIGALPGGGRADRILVDRGPGSFTGVRVGLAAARALGFAWGSEVLGYSSTALIAAAAFRDRPFGSLAVVLIGGHGELFVHSFSDPPMQETRPLASLAPPAALAAVGDLPLIGSGAAQLATLRGDDNAFDALPDAADMLLLPEAFATTSPTPLYGRAPDARPPAAR